MWVLRDRARRAGRAGVRESSSPASCRAGDILLHHFEVPMFVGSGPIPCQFLYSLVCSYEIGTHNAAAQAMIVAREKYMVVWINDNCFV